jgi:hypothetical protein
MAQFDTAPAATSNPFSVNHKQFLSRNREMLDDRREAPRAPAPGAGAAWANPPGASQPLRKR